jgi:hypothetical protein
MLVHLPTVFLAAFSANAVPVKAVVDNPPKFDITRECRFEGGPQVTQTHCAEDEKQALQQLQKEWPQFTAIARSRCMQESSSDGNASYVEFLTCLEMMRDTLNAQK